MVLFTVLGKTEIGINCCGSAVYKGLTICEAQGMNFLLSKKSYWVLPCLVSMAMQLYIWLYCIKICFVYVLYLLCFIVSGLMRFFAFFMLCFTYPRHKWVLNVLEASQLIEPVSVPVVLLWFSRLVPARLGTRLHPALSSALRRLKDLECQTDCRQKFHFWWSIALCWHKKLWMRACTWRCWRCCEKCGNSSSPIHLW